MDLASAQVINHGRVTEIPISNTIIKSVEKMGYKQCLNIYVKLDFSVKGKLKVDNVHAAFAVHAHTGSVICEYVHIQGNESEN